MNEGQFYVTYLWMAEELGLTWPQLQIYAIVYGFTKNGTGVFNASAEKLGRWVGCNRKTALAALQQLCQKGLLLRKGDSKPGVIGQYIATCPSNDLSVKYPGTCPSNGQDMSVCYTGTCPTDGHNNKYYNKSYSKEDKKEPARAVRHRYGEYDNVLLTDDELQKLRDEIADIDALIAELSGYLASTGKVYKSHYATLRNWARRRTAQQQPARRSFGTPVLTDEDYLKDLPPWAVIDKGGDASA